MVYVLEGYRSRNGITLALPRAQQVVSALISFTGNGYHMENRILKDSVDGVACFIETYKNVNQMYRFIL
ncbi:MAG TPA: hypothetical protein VHK91_10630 [Flavisolibacter sp.]|jgi:hypothetical protein|nr:hypothetical protein [Flavisolibacter sp.]